MVHYLDTPPSAAQLREVLDKLGLPPRQLLRSGEDEYRQLNLADQALTEDALIEAMVAHPRLIERPILITADRAVIGRPPENILELLP